MTIILNCVMIIIYEYYEEKYKEVSYLEIAMQLD